MLQELRFQTTAGILLLPIQEVHLELLKFESIPRESSNDQAKTRFRYTGSVDAIQLISAEIAKWRLGRLTLQSAFSCITCM